MTQELDLTEMRAEVNEHGVLDIDQATELFDRLEAVEQALDFHTQRDRELKALLSLLTDRLDGFSYDELSSLIEDHPLDQWGEAYKSRLEQAEAAVARVREFVGEDSPSFFTNEAMHAYNKAMDEVTRALDGDGRA
ncbi:hypothetical protein [Glutamicibacter ardleyensis]|uniref:hypothetical protein n=1 Tax=Glutamicibacter ardleyensis TaxID=225894 RepID=UPI003FCF7956